MRDARQLSVTPRFMRIPIIYAVNRLSTNTSRSLPTTNRPQIIRYGVAFQRHSFARYRSYAV